MTMFRKVSERKKRREYGIHGCGYTYIFLFEQQQQKACVKTYVLSIKSDSSEKSESRNELSLSHTELQSI